MATASYNFLGQHGKPSIIVRPDGVTFLTANVITKEGKSRARVQNYGIPGLSGEGSTFFGAAPVPITWKLTLRSSSMGTLQDFERDLRSYAAGGRYTLVSETGKRYDNVEFRGYEPGEICSGDGVTWSLEAVVEFMWMQPTRNG